MGWRALVNSAFRWKGPTPATCGCNRWVVTTWAEPRLESQASLFLNMFYLLSLEESLLSNMQLVGTWWQSMESQSNLLMHGALSVWHSLTQAWSIFYSTNSVQSKLTNGSPICFLCHSMLSEELWINRNYNQPHINIQPLTIYLDKFYNIPTNLNFRPFGDNNLSKYRIYLTFSNHISKQVVSCSPGFHGSHSRHRLERRLRRCPGTLCQPWTSCGFHRGSSNTLSHRIHVCYIW